MKKEYDFVYLTNTPSFYKLNLCNEIAKEHNLLLVLYGYGDEAVNTELTGSEDFHFDYYFLNVGNSNNRSKAKTFIGLLRLMRSIQYRKVIYAGWFAIEYDLFAFLSSKKRNVMVCESSIFDVSMKGISGQIKKLLINRMSAILPSGLPHAQLFDAIGFKGIKHITGSVGIFNKPPRKEKIIHRPLRYIYVGRLVAVKNIDLLIEEFNRNGKPLTIVGSGVLENELKSKANNNISFYGFIKNEQLGAVYQSHDVFILPSYYEPWGLVVEEALYWGLPVIASDHVGSHIDMVRNLETGCIFKSNDPNRLHEAINQIEANYDKYYANVQRIDWRQRDREQIKAYTTLLG